MKTLREYIREADTSKRALGHFNFSTIDMLWGIFDAARGLDLPVVVGASEGERKFIGVHEVVKVVRSLRERFEYPIFLNADHTFTVDGVKEAIDAGFDSVIFDGGKVSYEENVVATKECVDYARASGRDVLVEGELGYIGFSSNVLEEVPEGAGAQLTDPAQATEFIQKTGADLLSPSVGTIHGMAKTGNPHINPESIAEIRAAAGVPLVLHGGSGSTDEDFKNAVAAGIALVHVSTSLRVAYRKGIEQGLQEVEHVAPYKYLPKARENVHKVVEEKLKLFNNL